MPEGWKTISVQQDVYDHLKEKWERNKTEYKVKYGVTSFAGFVTRILYQLSEEGEPRIRRQSNP